MNKSNFIFGLTILILTSTIAFFIFREGISSLSSRETSISWTSVNQRELANKLKSAGLVRQAIREYELYTQKAMLTKQELAKISYAIGKMYIDEGEYERALSWLYKVEIADPESTLKNEVALKIVNCLERLGKFHAAEYVLDSRVSRDTKEGESRGSKLVAEIGSDKIYLRDIDEALENMPSWMRKQFEQKGQKGEFLKTYVANELLYRKAKKLEYDKDPQLRKKLLMVEKELMINKVLEDELKDKIKMDDDDLRNYFEAHRKDYAQKEAARVSIIKAGLKEVADSVLEKLQKGEDFSKLAQKISLDKNTAHQGGKFPGWVRKGEDDLGIGNVGAVSKAIFSTKPGSIAPIVEAGGYYYIIRVEEKRPREEKSFEQSYEQVKNDYYMQKLQTYYKSLLEQVLKSTEVKMYPEALGGEDGK